MGVHISFNRTCDRCEKPFDYQTLKYETGLPVHEPKPLVLTDGGKQVFSYDDLCSKCDGVVRNLIKKLTLDAEEPSTDAKHEAEKTPKEVQENAEPEATPKDGTHPF